MKNNKELVIREIDETKLEKLETVEGEIVWPEEQKTRIKFYLIITKHDHVIWVDINSRYTDDEEEKDLLRLHGQLRFNRNNSDVEWKTFYSILEAGIIAKNGTISKYKKFDSDVIEFNYKTYNYKEEKHKIRQNLKVINNKNLLKLFK